MRMARVNVTIPDALVEQARAEGLNISRVAATALSDALERRARVADLDSLLDRLDAELGPVPAEESEAARAWADRELGRESPQGGRTTRTG